MAILTRCATAALFFLLAAVPVAAQDVRLAEQKIKAGMLYNFLKYTHWPEMPAGEPVRVCLYGGDPFDGNLQPMEERSVNGRPIRVQRLSDPTAAAICQLLVLDTARRSDWPLLQQQLASKPVLTLSEMKNFTGQGGMIEFDHHNSHVRALLNKEAMQATPLRVEDRLLNLVTIVNAGGSP